MRKLVQPFKRNTRRALLYAQYRPLFAFDIFAPIGAFLIDGSFYAPGERQQYVQFNIFKTEFFT
jgi:hypothetical protein